MVKAEDREKPISFDVGLETFLVEALQLRRRECITVIAELTSMGLVNPAQALSAWRRGELDENWLIEKGKIDSLEVADLVKRFQIAAAALQFKTELSKVLGGLGWMKEGEEEVNPSLSFTLTRTLSLFSHFLASSLS